MGWDNVLSNHTLLIHMWKEIRMNPMWVYLESEGSRRTPFIRFWHGFWLVSIDKALGPSWIQTWLRDFPQQDIDTSLQTDISSGGSFQSLGWGHFDSTLWFQVQSSWIQSIPVHVCPSNPHIYKVCQVFSLCHPDISWFCYHDGRNIGRTHKEWNNRWTLKSYLCQPLLGYLYWVEFEKGSCNVY